ncbi:MAG TPA: M56 family metallopeptidase, partial [Gemmataceae bacterium]|nr:M56 family metallopeptidase [Gemmataceae bacterium]
MIDWLYSNALGAAVLAVIAAVLIWTFRPGPAVRHALWLVVLVKLVSPTGLWVSVPLPVESPVAEDAVVTLPQPPSPPAPEPEDVVIIERRFEIVGPLGQDVEQVEWAADAEVVVDARAEVDETDVATLTARVEAAAAEPASFDYGTLLIAAWVLGAGYFAWRSVRESLKFSGFARRSVPAPDHLRAEVAAVARKLGVRAPAVRVLTGLTSPLMWCLGRPVLLWPAGLDARLKGDGRKAVIAHELAHLRRRDHWVRRLEMAAVLFHWWNPVFWVARRRLRADAELACDAWAAGQADRRAYAEALLEVCSFNHRRRPAPAVGVSGEGRRAMQERLTMIMKDRVPCRLAFGAKLVVALMAVAAVPAWTLGQGKPAADDVQKIEAELKALTEKLAAVKAAKAAAEAQKAEAAKAQAEAAKAKAAAVRVQLAGQGGKDVLLQKVAGAPNVKVLTAGEDGVKVIGPDGKELKDVKVIVIDKKAVGAAQSGKTTTTESPKRVELKLATPPGTKNVPNVYEWKAAPGQGTFKVESLPGGDKFTLRGIAGEGGASVTLSRAAYKLDKGQAEALAKLLGNVKASVLEVKVEDGTLTLTTTPDVQATVG